MEAEFDQASHSWRRKSYPVDESTESNWLLHSIVLAQTVLDICRFALEALGTIRCFLEGRTVD
jgi:hypothetical protein